METRGKCCNDTASQSSDKSRTSVKLSVPNLFKTFTKGVDPLREHLIKEDVDKIIEQIALQELAKPKRKKEARIKPKIEIREFLSTPPLPTFPRPPYIIPETKKQSKARIERRLQEERERNFCKTEYVELSPPYGTATIGKIVNVPSPEISASKLDVLPRKPSPSPSSNLPDQPSTHELDLHKPKSGIFVNVTEPGAVRNDIDSFDLVYRRKPRPKRPSDFEEEEEKKKEAKKKTTAPQNAFDALAGNVTDDDAKNMELEEKKAAMMDELVKEAEQMAGEDEGESDVEVYLTKMFRRKVSQISKATSLNSKELVEFPVYNEEDLENQPYMTKIIQKFRRDSEVQRYKPPVRKIKRGTLESHSFTELTQPTIKNFYFGLVMGTINQSDEHFPSNVKGLQGVCIPVAAYCYSMIIHPNKWNEFIVDDILEVGTKLYLDSASEIHMHQEKKEIEFYELHKYCFIENKRFKFQLFEPEIAGLIRSGDPKVYNLSKALKLFFNRHQAGILKTVETYILIWKEKYFYFFDGKGRSKDLIPDEMGGKAVLANFYDIPDLTTVLLEYGNFGNWPFNISKLSIFSIMNKNEPDEDFPETQLITEKSDYNILNENKAVIQGSFDLGDLCFDFSRNKQSIAMAAVCLVYSRITPPSAWHSKTVDKIMIIGNQLYLELVESENVVEMALEDLPAVFTIGPYVIGMLIYSNVYADLLYRKGTCMLQKSLEMFFETNTMAIIYIGNFVIAIWQQRNMYYCFDPYSRNGEALKCRNGTACISMNSNLATVIETVSTNFDGKDDVYYVHALKVIKIHRDPAQNNLFPKTMTMDDYRPECFKEYKMQKSKKKAVDSPVTADFGETAVKKLLPWGFLQPSLIEVGSGIESLAENLLPPMFHKSHSKAILLPEVAKPIDLDSPSLSDTQIDPERPAPVQGEEAINFESWELTQEELEMQEGEDEDAGEDELDSYMAMNQFAQAHPESLESYHSKISVKVNTDITVGFLPVPREVLHATNMRWKQKQKKEKELARKRDLLISQGIMVEPEITQSEELAKKTNFIDLPDKTQLIRGSQNISEFGTKLGYMAPFVCMIATAVAEKYALRTWSTEIVDYALRTGTKLYELSRVRYDQVPVLEVPKVSLGRSNYNILVEYLYDSLLKQPNLEISLERILFKKYSYGLVVTPLYACAVFLKNHLYYMYDPFGCNEVGLGEDSVLGGVACLARFRNVHDLASRIIYNKTKRDTSEEYKFTRFIISGCTSKLIPPKEVKVLKAKKRKGAVIELGEDEDEAGKGEDEEKEEPEPENQLGYQLYEGTLALHASMALSGRYEANYNELKEDHFVCICACLMALICPVLKWDTQRVDYVIEQGKSIFAHAEFLKISHRRIIRNILIYKNFFDIIVTSIKIPEWKDNKDFATGLSTVMKKRNYAIVQFPNQAYTIYKHNDWFHIFDPYACSPNGNASTNEEGTASWVLYQGLDAAKERIRRYIVPNSTSYIFYTFEVSSVRRASKKTATVERFWNYDLNKPITDEVTGKPFHEKDTWLRKDPIAWSRIKANTASGKMRGKRENMWHDWDIEYFRDLFSLIGTKHQNSEEFDETTRGKQTIANLIVAIGMMEIYELSEWTTSVMDSILINGNAYFLECVKEISEENYELTFDDLITSCSIYPYKFEVFLTPVVEGTLFLMRSRQFNLYKALRLFFDKFACRYGICCVTKGEEETKRIIAFGKVQEHEYFMYDCQSFGPPMFVDGQGVSYIMRCRTLKRLLHVMVLTLRGGDFYILQVDVTNFKSLV